MKRASVMFLALMVSLFGFAVFAQQGEEQLTAQVMESERFGPYLTDSEGNTLYLFVNEELEGQGPERMTEGVREAAVSCTDECINAWPAFTGTEGEVQAGEGLDPELLYVAEFDGRMQVVYNGWPLFYFARDEEPGQINGQEIESFGGEWYIVGPEGQIVRSEQESTTAEGEGDGEGDVAGGGGADEEESAEGDEAGGGADEEESGEADAEGDVGGEGAADEEEGAEGGDGEAGQDDGGDDGVEGGGEGGRDY